MTPTEDDMALYEFVRDNTFAPGSMRFFPTEDPAMTEAFNRLGAAGLVILKPLNRMNEYVWIAEVVDG